MKKTLRLMLIPLLAATLWAAEKKSAAPRSMSNLPGTGDYVFSILPKSLQKDPTLEMTVNTEFTDYGRMLRPASPTQPVYYVAQSGGFKRFGAFVGGEKSPPAEELERALKKALAANGFLPVESGQTPSLVLIYFWGSHNNEDPETRAAFPALAAKNKLERAILVGGKKYAAQTGEALEFGESLADRTQERQFLRDQIDADVYFVVASAYDYQSVAQGNKKLAWRTSMTVNTTGVSMVETLSPLVAIAAPFFGRETEEPQINVRRVPRSTRVDVGTPTVVPEKTGKP